MGSDLKILLEKKSNISDLLDTTYKTAIKHLTHTKKKSSRLLSNNTGLCLRSNGGQGIYQNQIILGLNVSFRVLSQFYIY